MNKIVSEEFRKLKGLNKPVRNYKDWTKCQVVVISPLSWKDNLSASIPFASRQRIMAEAKDNMAVVKVSGTNYWAICHLDTGTVVKQIENGDINSAKVEAERYGKIFHSLNDPILTLENVQDVIKQSLKMDELREENPQAYQMELN